LEKLLFKEMENIRRLNADRYSARLAAHRPFNMTLRTIQPNFIYSTISIIGAIDLQLTL